MGDPIPIRDGIAATLERMLANRVPWVSDAQIAAHNAAERRDRRAELMRHAGLEDVIPPEDFRRVEHDRLDDTLALGLVQRWQRYQRGGGGRPVLALMGSMGRGKTLAAAWLIAQDGGRYVEAEEICRLHATRWGDDRERYRRLLTCRVLVVDEVGTEERPEAARAALHEVVNRRQGRRLTLLLGNLDRAAFADRLDPRTVDRLRACGTIAEVDGPSLRRGSL